MPADEDLDPTARDDSEFNEDDEIEVREIPSDATTDVAASQSSDSDGESGSTSSSLQIPSGAASDDDLP